MLQLIALACTHITHIYSTHTHSLTHTHSYMHTPVSCSYTCKLCWRWV